MRGQIISATHLFSGEWMLSIKVNAVEEIRHLAKDEDVDIEIKKHREKRSLNANALLWKCLGEIAASLRTDKWEVYLKMLRRYGEFTYVCVRPNAVDMMKKQWRECEEIGPIDINGQQAVQLLCYYGSSTYDSKQFSRLLDGVISEMEEMGMETPASEQIRHCIEMMENQELKKETNN